MSDSEDVDELEHNEIVQNITVFCKRERIHTNDDQLIEMDSFKKFNQMLTCPICLDIFQEPVYVKGCSHRFCKDCIEKAIRSSKTKQCPTCRKIIGTKRQLRIDYNVQEIISLIYGDISKFLEQKQTNDELLLSKTYSQLCSNNDDNKKKKRKNASEKEKDSHQQQSSPHYSHQVIQKEEDMNNNGMTGISPTNIHNGLNKNESGDHHHYQDSYKKGSHQNQMNSQSSHLSNNQQYNKYNDKPGSSQHQNEQLNKKRKYNTQNNQNHYDNQYESTLKKGDRQSRNDDSNLKRLEDMNIYDVGYKQKYFSEEFHQKLQEEQMRVKLNGLFADENGKENKSSLNYPQSSSTKFSLNPQIERAFINIQIKVIPYDKLQKQFDFNILKLDWALTLEDVIRLICQKLQLNYNKYKQFVRLFAKSQSEDQFFHPLEDKSQLVKSIEDQFWNVESKYKYIRPYEKSEQAINISSEYIHQKAAQNRILYYVIEYKDIPTIF